MTTNLAKPDDALNAEEADRLAARLRPAWEDEDGDDLPPPGFGADKTQESAPIAEAGASPAHDTLVDRRSDPSAITRDEKRPASGAPGPTRLGLGDPADGSSEGEEAKAEGPAIVSSKIVSIGDPTPVEAKPNAPPKPTKAKPTPVADETKPAARAPKAEPPPKEPPAEAASEPAGSSEPPNAAASEPPAALEPIAPQAASFSRADDPIEIPVQKTSKAVVYAIAGAVALAAIVGGITLFGGDKSGPETAKTAAPTAANTAEPAKTTEPAATAEPAKTAAPAPEPAKTTEPAPTETAKAAETSAPEATAKAAATATPAPEPKPVAAAKPKSTSSGSSGASAPASGTTKKPPKSGGTGIIRDAPF